MDIVYLWNHYKDGTELRYSLRALEKNGQNVSRVWLLGRKPDWASDEITEIGYDSNKNLHKENDITAAIFRAAEVPELGNRFLICADDYYYIRPTDFDRYPIYLKNRELPEAVTNNPKFGGNLYQIAAVNTRAILMAAGLPFANYSEHACFPADKKLMHEFAHLFRAAFLLERGILFDSAMANIIVDKTGETPVPRKDNKILTAANYNDLLRQIGDTECFSTEEKFWNLGGREILTALFPDKSIFER